MIELCDIESAIENKAAWETVRYLADDYAKRGFVLSRIALREKWARAQGIPSQHVPVFSHTTELPLLEVVAFHGGVEFRPYARLKTSTVREIMRDTEDGI